MEGKLADAGIEINCFGSAIANWQVNPTNPEHLEEDLRKMERALPRMERLGTKLLRGMSCVLQKDRRGDDPEIESIVMEHLKELVKRCEDHGVVYGHENCNNYGGQSFLHSLKLVEAMDSPAFTLIFDMGNTVVTPHRVGEPPYEKQQEAWEFYKNIKEHISYVHIKDAKPEGSPPIRLHTYPGEGSGDVVRIVKDLLHSGYDGGFSMEPHLFQLYRDIEDLGEQAEVKKQTYIEFGRRFMKIVEEIKGG